MDEGVEQFENEAVKQPESIKDIPKIEVKIEDRNIESFGGVDMARETSEAVAKRIEKDGIREKLTEFKKFAGSFINQKVENGLRVSLVHGMPGNGEVADGVLTVGIQTKAEMEAIDAKMATGEIISDVKETNNYFELLKSAGLTHTEVTMDQVSSTTMHELEHEIIDSRPDSELRKRFEEVTQIKNDEGNYTMSFLDEGIVYAFQFLKDSTNENFSKMMKKNTERSEEDRVKLKEKDPAVAMREELGRQLLPVVKEYIDHGTQMNDDFLRTAGEKMKEIGIEKYVSEMKGSSREVASKDSKEFVYGAEGSGDHNYNNRERSGLPDSYANVIADIVKGEGNGKRTFLDVGGGTGELATRIDESTGVDSFTIDYSPFGMIDRDYKKGVVADAVKLPVASGSVDILHTKDMIDHLNPIQLGAFLDEAKRVLSTDGKIIVTEKVYYAFQKPYIGVTVKDRVVNETLLPNEDYTSASERLKMKYGDEANIGAPYFVRDRRSLEKILQNSGLKIEKIAKWKAKRGEPDWFQSRLPRYIYVCSANNR